MNILMYNKEKINVLFCYAGFWENTYWAPIMCQNYAKHHHIYYYIAHLIFTYFV